MYKRSCSTSVNERVEPSITGLIGTVKDKDFLLALSSVLINSLSLWTELMRKPSSISLHDIAMFSAVYSVSPVSIIKFIPPCLRA